MRITISCLVFILFFSCAEKIKLMPKQPKKAIAEVQLETIFNDSTLSIRALDFDDDYVFYGSFDHFGKRTLHKESNDVSDQNENKGKRHFKNIFKNEKGKALSFRAVKQINGTLFAISIGNPARLYKLNTKAEVAELVYEETHEKVFYDALLEYIILFNFD